MGTLVWPLESTCLVMFVSLNTHQEVLLSVAGSSGPDKCMEFLVTKHQTATMTLACPALTLLFREVTDYLVLKCLPGFRYREEGPQASPSWGRESPPLRVLSVWHGLEEVVELMHLS